jgi:hypothetical protein
MGFAGTLLPDGSSRSRSECASKIAQGPGLRTGGCKGEPDPANCFADAGSQFEEP